MLNKSNKISLLLISWAVILSENPECKEYSSSEDNPNNHKKL